MAFDHTLSLIASAGANLTVHVWDYQDATFLGTCAGHDAEVTCVDVSADGSMLLSGQQQNNMGTSSVILWDYHSRTARHRAASHNGGVSDGKISPDGKFVATLGMSDGSLYIMETASMKLVGQLADPMCGESGRGSGREMGSVGVDG